MKSRQSEAGGALPRLAVTMGDPAGIGPEIALKALCDPEVTDICRPWLFGDVDVLRAVARRLNLPMPGADVPRGSWLAPLPALDGPAVVHHGVIDVGRFQPGRVNIATGRAAYTYIVSAIHAAQHGDVDAVVTGPIHKESLRAAGVQSPGHTEIFAALTKSSRTCMMLTSEALTCSFVTTHVGYRDVPGWLSVQRVLDVIELTAEAMVRLRRRAPRLAVCGLNPHAGESGLFGDGEEEAVITPAIQRARLKGIDAEGPLPPDTAFLPKHRAAFDAVVCMYHDQGHIPLKTLAFDEAVNITLGLPIVRTSVDHGTALDIAWQGLADPKSLVQAVRQAVQLAQSAPAEAIA